MVVVPLALPAAAAPAHHSVPAKPSQFAWARPQGGRAQAPQVPIDPHAQRKGELTGKRTANETFYQLSDGRVQEEVSTTPVHYRDSQGAWQPISTAVKPLSHGQFSAGAESNSFHTYFSGQASSLLRVEQGAGFIQLGVDGAGDAKPAVSGSTVTYKGILGGADLRYEVGPQEVKDGIVLANAPASDPTYTFSIKVGGYTPQQRPDGSIAFVGSESSQPAFVIPAPYMSDARVDKSSPYGVVYSANVKQTMQWDAATGTLRVSVRPDPSWLRAAARKYPVVIDPTVLVAPTPSEAANVMILSDSTTTNYDTSYRLSVGTTTTGVARTLIKFPMPSVPTATTISSASLNLYYDQDHTTDSNNVTLEAHQATAAWDPTTATWQNANGISGALLGSTTKQANVTSVWNNYPVTSAVQSWVNGTSPNYGFVIKAQNESTLGQGGPRYEASTYAYNGETANYPQLVITYGVPGVPVNPPTTIHSTGAELSWPAYSNTSGNSANDIVEYQVHRSIYESFTPSASTEVAPVPNGTLSFTDSTAQPTPTSSTDLYGNVYYYMVAVKTASGALIAGPTQIVRLPKAGLTEVIVRNGSATTLSSTQQTSVLNTLLDSGIQKPEVEVGDNSSTYGTARAVFDFGALPSTIPTTATVLDAHLKVWQEVTTTNTSGAVYELHALNQSFAESQATWKNATSSTPWTTAGGDYNSAVASTVSGLTNDPNRQTFDASTIVQGWINSPSSNHGLELKLANETSKGAQERTIFAGTNTAEPLLSPTLVVTYLDPTPADTYYAPTTPEKMVPGTTYTVPVTINNTTTSTLPATEALTYHWALPNGSDVTGSGNQLTTALPSSLAPGAAVTVNAQVTPPTPTDSNDKGAYTLAWDMKNTSTGAYLSTSAGGIGSLAQAVGVDSTGSNQLGLESFYQYSTTATGSGSALYTNESSGNTVWNYNALSNPSRGFATFARMSYNSLDTTDSTTGFGWSIQLSTPTRLGTPLDFHPKPNPTEVSFTDGDGTSHVFTWNASASTWNEPAGVHLYLQQLATCGPQVTNARAWVMTRPDRTQFFYDCDGYPTAVVDKNGNEGDFTYSSRNSQNKPTEFLSYITDPTGRRTLTVNYYAKGDDYQYIDANGNIVSDTKLTDPQIIDHVKSVTDISGREVDFLYTTQGLLGRLVDGAGNSAAKTFSFGYDATQGMKNVKLVKVTDPRGDSTGISYYDPPTDPKFHWWTQNVTDRANGMTSFAYVEPGSIAGATEQATVTDANSHATVYQLDATGRLVQTVNALNQKLALTWDDQNNVTSITEDNGARSTYTYDPATGYPLTRKDAQGNKDNTAAETYTYQTSLSGHIADITDKTTAGGRHWHFTYDSAGDLLTIQDPNGTQAGAGYTSTNTYDTSGELATSTDANNHTTRYSDYDPSGYPKTVTDPLGHATTSVYGPRGEVTSTTDPLQHTSSQNYDRFLRTTDSRTPKDQANNVYIVTPTPVYDANDNIIQRTGPNGAVATATYDADDRVTSSTLPQDSSTSPVRKTTYTYDAVGNRLTTTTADGNVAGAPAGSYTSKTTYDALNQATTVTDANGQQVTTEFDDVGNAVKSTDPLNHATQTGYDLDHRATTVTDASGFASSTAYDMDGLKVSTTDRNGATTLLTYDQDGRLTKQQVPHTGSGASTTYNTTEYTYDQVGNRTATITPRGVASGVAGAFTNTTTYDADNRKTAVFGAYDPNDPTYHTAPETDYTYDLAGRLATTTGPQSGDSAVRPLTTYAYWDNGWTRSSTDPWSITTSYDYNPIGKQTVRTITSAGGSSSRSQGWDYYPDGKLRTKTDNGVPVGLQVELVDNSDKQSVASTGSWSTVNSATAQGYDYQTHAAGAGTDTFTWNLSIPEDGTYSVYVQYPSVANAATNAQYTIGYTGGSATATLDQTKNGGTWVQLGRYSFTTAGTNQTISLAQNSGGAVAADAVKVVRDNSLDPQPNPTSFSYSYDPDGNLTNLTDASPNARYDAYTLSYDGVDQLTQMQEKSSGVVKHTTTFGYDAAGNAVSEGHDGASATYTFDARNALASVVNRESSSDPNPKTTSYTYTPDGVISTETKANGNQVTSTYNLDNSLASAVEKTTSGTVIAQHTYTYDPDGNQTQDVSAVQSADDNATTLNRTSTHTYTPHDQIATVTNSDGKANQSYTYDLAGNITTQTVSGVTTTNLYDRNRLLTATTAGVTNDYNYDPFGRTDTVTAGGTVQQRYSYDGFDRITSETKKTASGTVNTSYTYDPFDRTVSQTDNSKTTVFDYLATSKAVVSESVGGSITKSYQYAPTGERLDQIVHNTDGSETPTYYSYNAHSDVQAITDVNGKTKSTYAYTAYGSDDSSQDTGVDKGTGDGSGTGTTADPYNVYRFNADRIDPTTGNYDMGFRNYDPSTNRFLSRDMYDGAFADTNMSVDPYTGNRYAFGGGNPLSNVEIDGHFSIGGFISSAVKDVEDVVKPIVEDPVVDDSVDTGNPFLIAGAVFLSIILHPDPTAKPGGEYPMGAKPDYEKGLYVQPDKKVEWKPGDMTEPKTRQDCGKGGNFVYYSPLDDKGRATGVLACLSPGGFNYTNSNGQVVGNPDSQISGSPVPWPPGSPGYSESTPPGWSLDSDPKLQRGHLLANQLGGIGDDRRNLVPLYAYANSPVMKGYEDQVAASIAAGNTVFYTAKPIYSGDSPIPLGVTLEAWTSTGQNILDVTVVNQPKTW